MDEEKIKRLAKAELEKELLREAIDREKERLMKRKRPWFERITGYRLIIKLEKKKCQ